MEKISAGIDLGTTNSCLAVLQGDRPVVIPNDLGDAVTPSVVSVLPEGIVVGKKARSRLLTHPANTFASIKRRMGERYSRTVLGREYTPESVSAHVLAHVKKCGESRLGATLDDVVITVPAHFNSIQRQATKDAAEIAGFNVLRVLNEPTAAALAYGHEHQLSTVLVVFDLGGGTFDISVVEAGDGLYEVIHSAGDNHLGGDDFNLRIVQWIVEEFQKLAGLDIRRDVPAMCLVHEWAIAAKHALTQSPEVRVKIPNLAGKDFSAVLTRQAFETMCRDLFNRLRTVAWKVSEELRKSHYADAHPGVFDDGLAGCDILLVGGETRVPAVRQLVQTIFKGRVHTDVNPDEVVAMGAALQAGIIHQQRDIKDIVLVDSTALPLGIAVQGELFSRVVEANTRIPCSRSNVYQPAGDFAPFVVIAVYQGESDLVAKNIKLGEFTFQLDPPRRVAEAAILVTFQLDANDILHVTAVDKATGNTQKVTIKDSQNLDRETVERLRREARQTKSEDKDEVRLIQRRQSWRDVLEGVSRRLRALPGGDQQEPEVKQVQRFAEQLHRALTDKDDALAERAARDLEAAVREWDAHGQPVHEEPSAEPTSFVDCANCGARLPPGFAFCGKCGVPLKKDSCSACGAALVEGFQFCGKCGAKLE